MNTQTAASLINYGVVRLNDAAPGDSATIIVVGLPRSGTSMVAAVLKSLGIFMGRVIDNVVFEDHEMADALEPGKEHRLSNLIATRNAQHRTWGFKRPEAYKQLGKLCAECRNPRVIVTFRDILAISLRNNIAMQIDPIQSLPRLAREYETLASAIKKLLVPCLLISYEKAIQFPEKVVGEIGDFCGVEVTEHMLEQGAAIIDNGNPQYVQAARLQYQGFVGRLIDGQLRGWVKVQKRDQLRVNVELEVDGKIVQRARADVYRPDVEQAGFGDGKYGFIFPIGDGIGRDSIVNVRIANSSIVVKNSGLPLSKY
jgi:hypothetical protein